jgi:hypothetical protein
MRTLVAGFVIFFILVASLSAIGTAQTVQPSFASRYIETRYGLATTDSVEIADVDRNWAGNEVIYTGWGWGVSYVYGEGDNWTCANPANRSYDVWYAPALVVGDIDPDVDGNEIVEGLYELIVWTYDNTTGNWTNTTIWNPWGEIGSVILDVKIGDFDPLHTGNELLAISDQVYEFYKASNSTWVKINISGTWNHSTLHGCDIGNFDPRFDGNEIIVFTEENITEFAWNGTMWSNETIDVSCFEGLPGEISSGCIGEVNSTNDVDEIICGSRFRWIIEVSWNKTGYDVQIIQDVDEIGSWVSSVAVGDCWTGHVGNEIVAGGTTAARTMLIWDNNGTWQKQLIYENNSEYSVNDIEIGDFDSAHPGNEIALGAIDLFELHEALPVTESTSQIFVFAPMICIIPAVIWRLRQEWR